MSTGIVVAIVIGLMLLALAMVANQLIRLRKWLKNSPTSTPPPDEPPEQPR